MHCIFTTTNGVKLYVLHSFVQIYGIFKKKQALEAIFVVLNYLTKWIEAIIFNTLLILTISLKSIEMLCVS